jgi:hypothetical protein
LLGIEEESSEWGIWSSDSFSKFSEVGSSGVDGFVKLLSSFSKLAGNTETEKEKEEKEKNKDL